MKPVKGHALLHEGAPYDNSGKRIYRYGSGGEGRAKCECGAMSESTPSLKRRKEWHRDHKETVLFTSLGLPSLGIDE